MNTHGHAEVAEEAGLPLLRSFFGGQSLNSFEAMRLGNWLTDVSQAVDPVTYAKKARDVKDLVDKVHKFVDALLEQTSSAVVGTLPPVVQEGVQRVFSRLEDLAGPRLDGLKKRVHAAIDGLLGTEGADERASDLAQFFRAIFFVIGYFKFVHPAGPNSPPRMDYAAFLAVFGAVGTAPGAQNTQPTPERPGSFTQYYPYEHLDRPERLKPAPLAGAPPIFEPGPQSDESNPKGPTPLGPRSLRSLRSLQEHPVPDIYSYIRDDMMMTAGLLGEVDRELRSIIDPKAWKSLWQALESGKPPENLDPKLVAALERSVPWHKALAKLGHALHQVEDFFAHSNWIELAAQMRGDAYLSKVLPPALPAKLQKLVPVSIAQEILERTRTVFAKRLKRHLTQPKPDWKGHPAEPWVITGYYDGQDFLISLAHLTEELWGGDVPDPWQNINELDQTAAQAVKQPSTALEQVQKLIRNTGDFLSNHARALQDPDNDVAQAWKNNVGKNLDRLETPMVQEQIIRQLARQSPLIAGARAEVQSSFINAMVIATRLRGAVSLYESIKTLTDFFKGPISWIRDELHLTWADPFIFWSRELLYDYVGMDRIGSHSLMAKDHGGEPLYEPNKQCATAVHYSIVRTLLKPWEDGPKPAIDWLALLEFFLQNPGSMKPGRLVSQSYELPVAVIHEVAAGEQLDCDNPKFSLTKRYAKTAMGPFTRKPFTWRTIADANFRTAGLSEAEAQRVINLTLATKKTGVPVTPPNYALKPGTKLVIPNQRLRLTRRVLAGEPWFATVMDKGWKIFRGEDATTGTKVTPLDPYQPIRISRDETQLQIVLARDMRQRARQDYRPTIAA